MLSLFTWWNCYNMHETNHIKQNWFDRKNIYTNYLTKKTIFLQRTIDFCQHGSNFHFCPVSCSYFGATAAMTGLNISQVHLACQQVVEREMTWKWSHFDENNWKTPSIIWKRFFECEKLKKKNSFYGEI